MDDRYTYGLGIVISGDWLLQDPMFAGLGAVEAYLPARKLAIAVAVTFAPGVRRQRRLPQFRADAVRTYRRPTRTGGRAADTAVIMAG